MDAAYRSNTLHWLADFRAYLAQKELYGHNRIRPLPGIEVQALPSLRQCAAEAGNLYLSKKEFHREEP